MQKALIAAQYNGVKVETPAFEFPADLAKLKDKNPNAKVPTMDTPFGSIYESDAIVRYSAHSTFATSAHTLACSRSPAP